jgi:hypothetical protein
MREIFTSFEKIEQNQPIGTINGRELRACTPRNRQSITVIDGNLTSMYGRLRVESALEEIRTRTGRRRGPAPVALRAKQQRTPPDRLHSQVVTA